MSVWKLNGREAKVVVFGSGQYDWITIRIRWSKKLGLILKHRYDCAMDDIDTHTKAARLVEAINQKGSINIDYWKKVYYPSRAFMDRYSD